MSFQEDTQSPGRLPPPYFERNWLEFIGESPVGALVLVRSYLEREDIAHLGRVALIHVSIDGHANVPAWRIQFSRKSFMDVARALGELFRAKFCGADLLVTECRHGDRILPLVLTSHFSGVFDETTDAPPHTDPAWVAVKTYLPLARIEYGPHLDRLARLLGRNIRYHLFKSPCLEPCTEYPDEIHLLSGVAPPGERSDYFHARFLFGHCTTVDGGSIAVEARTPDRGIAVQDSISGHVIAQVLGNTWYLLFPALRVINRSTSALILKDALRCIWTAVLADRGLPRRRMRPGELIEGPTKLFGHIPTLLAQRIKKAEVAFEEAQRALAVALADLHIHGAIAQSVSGGRFTRRERQEFIRDWKRIATNPYVDALFAGEDSAVLIRTRPLILTHEGVRYDIGALYVRVSFITQGIGVWPAFRKHPLGIAHPHVNVEGYPCFGNASVAIMTTLGEFRVADTIEYIIRWLRDGYDPTLASRKIEEWPKEAS